MAIAINHDIKLPSSLGTLYSPSGEDLGIIENELQLNDLQIQICRENATGYYIIWKDQKIDIRPNGEFSPVSGRFRRTNQASFQQERQD